MYKERITLLETELHGVEHQLLKAQAPDARKPLIERRDHILAQLKDLHKKQWDLDETVDMDDDR